MDEMDLTLIPDNPYLLLIPGPLSTTKSVRAAMLRDWCTWEDDYHQIVQEIRNKLTNLATSREGYTSVLMQGSGTFSIEAVIGTAIPAKGRLLVLSNGAYGKRIVEIAHRLNIQTVVHDSGERNHPDLDRLWRELNKNKQITHAAVVHCETTTGILNPIREIGRIVKGHEKIFIVDAMSSFGGIPLDMAEVGADFLVSSSNQCIQGAPGFGFTLAKRSELQKTKGRARSLSLDLYDQWQAMETQHGKWRYTSPTHVVRAFAQALRELEDEGGIQKRFERYHSNQRTLVEGMRHLGFRTLLPDQYQSPIITSFHNPQHKNYEFNRFYSELKSRGFVIYSGKVTSTSTFRIGNIGDVGQEHIRQLLKAVADSMYWK